MGRGGPDPAPFSHAWLPTPSRPPSGNRPRPPPCNGAGCVNLLSLRHFFYFLQTIGVEWPTYMASVTCTCTSGIVSYRNNQTTVVNERISGYNSEGAGGGGGRTLQTVTALATIYHYPKAFGYLDSF